MTTLDEISSIAQANHCYWTEWARYYLAVYRERKAFNQPLYLVNGAKRSFRNCIHQRKQQEYLIK